MRGRLDGGDQHATTRGRWAGAGEGSSGHTAGGSGQRWPEVLGGVISYEGSVKVDALMRLVRRSRGLPDALGSCRSGSRGRFAKLGRARGSTYVMRVWLQLEDAQCFRQRAWLRRKVCVLCAVFRVPGGAAVCCSTRTTRKGRLAKPRCRCR